MSKIEDLNAEQQAALLRFKEKHGRCWKKKLQDKWLDGSDVKEPNGHLLRQIRNQNENWLTDLRIE